MFKKGSREKFKEGQQVRVAKRKNLGNRVKSESGRFVYLGKILKACEGDSYIVRTENGRIIKKTSL